MSITHGNQLYKEKEQQELLHVEQQQQTRLREVNQPQEQQTAQVQEQDLLGKYEEQTEQIDLTDVVNRQQNMPQQVVAASPLHDSARAEEILKGNELSQRQQERLQEQEQQLVQEAQVTEQHAKEQVGTNQEEQQDSSASSAYEALRALHEELQADHDSASPEFQAVKQKMDQMMSVMDQPKGMSLQENALLELRQAAVHYYNTHRGYRWSSKGKRRKNLINRIVDQVQKAVVSDETPVAVKYSVLNRIMSDTSPEGFSSKKTVEFARAQAKTEAERDTGTEVEADQVDEYSFKMYCYEKQSIENMRVADQQYDLTNRVREMGADKVLNMRDWGVYMTRYQVDTNGEPLTEADRQTREKSNRFFDAMTKGTDVERREILMEEMSKVAAFECKPEMMSADYICAHYGELRELSLRFGALENLIKASANKQAYEGIEPVVKKDYEFQAEILKKYMLVVMSVSKIKNIKQGAGFNIEDEDIGMPQLPQFAKEYAKRGHIRIDPDQELARSNDHIYKGENGYVRQELSMDRHADYEDALLNLIEDVQRPKEQWERMQIRSAVQQAEETYQHRLQEDIGPREVTDQKQELAELKQMFMLLDQVDLKQYDSMSVEELMGRYSDLLMLQDRISYFTDKMQYYLAYGGDLDESTIRRLSAKASYVNTLKLYVEKLAEVVKNPAYETLGAGLLETASVDELQALQNQTEEEKIKDYYRELADIKRGSLRADVSNYDDYMEKNMARDMKDFINLKAILARYEKERRDDPERAERLADRRHLLERAVKAYVEYQRKRDRIVEIGRRKNGGQQMVRYVTAQLMFPGMSNEQVVERAQNLCSEDQETRHAEYNRIFDQILSLDLTQFEHLDTDEKLVDNMELIMKGAEIGLEIGNILDVASQDHMEIPMERREELMKWYSYLNTLLANLLRARLDLIVREGYGELTREEEPQSAEQAMEERSEKYKDNKKMQAWLQLAMPWLFDRSRFAIDLNGSLREQYRTYQRPQ